MDFLDPEKIISQLDSKDDMLVADLGSGSGRFSIPLAKRARSGMVWALDVQKQPLVFLKSRCIKENINNINVVCCDLEKQNGSALAGSFFDLALAVDILFQAKDINAIISEAKRILKNKGIFFVSDKFPARKSARGVSPCKIMEATKNSGFMLKKEIDSGENRYGLVFEKNI